MGIYRKKPVVIEAFKWTGDEKQTEDPIWAIKAIKKGNIIVVNEGSENVHLLINTLEGVMQATRGTYIIKGVEGEIYPCKADIFKKTYEDVKN